MRLELHRSVSCRCRAADHKHICSGSLGVFETPGHGRRPVWVSRMLFSNLGSMYGGINMACPPGSRILHPAAVLLGILAFAAHNEPDSHRPVTPTHRSNGCRLVAGLQRRRRCRPSGEAALPKHPHARSQTVRLPAFGEQA